MESNAIPQLTSTLLNMTNANYEYRLVIKKKQTTACDQCRKRKGKCSGCNPCSYCVEKKLQCHFSQQQKRGKRKLENIDNTVETNKIIRGVEIWNDNERFATVDTFCEMRSWWNNLFDVNGIKEMKSPGFVVQSHLINAWMARLSKQSEKENYHYHEALNTLTKRDEKRDHIVWATAYLLMSDYDPFSPENYSLSCWDIAKNANPITKQEKHVYNYSMSCYALNVSPDNRHSNVLSFGSNALLHNSVDIFDTTNLMVVRICTIAPSYWGNAGSLEFFQDLKTLALSDEERNKTLMDIRTAEVIVESMPHLFGFEFLVCVKLMKMTILWAGGLRDDAVAEALSFAQNILELEKKSWFLLGESRFFVIAVSILHESGITKYNEPLVNLIYDICQGKHMLDDLIPLFDTFRLAATDENNNNNNNDNNNKDNNNDIDDNNNNNIDNNNPPSPSFSIPTPYSPPFDNSLLSLQQDPSMNWDNVDLTHFLA